MGLKGIGKWNLEGIGGVWEEKRGNFGFEEVEEEEGKRFISLCP